jgi:hypothetical protein
MIAESARARYRGSDDVLEQVLTGGRAIGVRTGMAGGIQNAGPDFPAFLFDGRNHLHAFLIAQGADLFDDFGD